MLFSIPLLRYLPETKYFYIDLEAVKVSFSFADPIFFLIRTDYEADVDIRRRTLILHDGNEIATSW